MREMKLLIFSKKEFFRIKVMYLKQKENEESKKLEENKFFRYIENESKGFNFDLFEKHFNFSAPTVLAKKVFETKDKNKNNNLVNVMKSGLRDLNNEIEKMSEDGKKITTR